VPQTPQLLLSVEVLVQAPLQAVCPAAQFVQTPALQTPLWQVVPEVHAVPVGAPVQMPLVHGCPAPQASAQLPQFDGSELVVSQMWLQSVPGHVSVSPSDCMRYSISRLTSAPMAETQDEPLRNEACSVAPAAKVRTIGPLSDQYWPGVSGRSNPVLLSVKRNTAAGQPALVGVLAVATMRRTVMAWSMVS
jgi:hypothetical protein